MPVARRYYSASECALLQTCSRDDRLRSFLQIWTFKESYVKAYGVGLGDDMRRVQSFVDAQGKLAAGVQNESADAPAHIRCIELGAEYVAALSTTHSSNASPRVACLAA
jgi:phosphopantetheinyl transferase